MSEHLISSREMARFVASGSLRFDQIVPEDLCRACREEMAHPESYFAVGTPFEETWPKDTALGEAFRLPRVRGIIESLLGPDPLYDHHFAHTVPARSAKGPNLHQDSVIDFRENYFDIQLSLFPVDTPDEMGGTFLVPGTHFRNVRTGEIGGYHHITGTVWASCRAGTLFVWNTRLWHGARTNRTDHDRYMYKLRLNPSAPQIRRFDTSDLDHPEIGEILSVPHGWEGDEMRYELMKRVEMWRYVSAQPDYDVGERFLRRREYQPQLSAR